MSDQNNNNKVKTKNSLGLSDLQMKELCLQMKEYQTNKNNKEEEELKQIKSHSISNLSNSSNCNCVNYTQNNTTCMIQVCFLYFFLLFRSVLIIIFSFLFLFLINKIK